MNSSMTSSTSSMNEYDVVVVKSKFGSDTTHIQCSQQVFDTLKERAALHPIVPHYTNDYQMAASSTRVMSGLREMGFVIVGMACNPSQDFLYWTLTKSDAFK